MARVGERAAVTTCREVMLSYEIDPDDGDVLCGEPVTGSGPCKTCCGYAAAFSHGSFVGVTAKNGHAYAPSEYVCEAGHVQPPETA